MSTIQRLGTTWLAIAALLINGSIGAARPSLGSVGGGGARGGGMSRPGGGGGGMSRPNFGGGGGGGISRPSTPNFGGGGISRPSMPSGGNFSRPSTPNFSPSRPSLPSVGARPSLPSNNLGSRPSLGGFQPGASKPNMPVLKPLPGGTTPGVNRPSLPNTANRPTLKPGGDLKPTTRPGTFPGSGTFPGTGGIANRPTPILPGKPGGATTLPSNRPGLGNIDRPTTLPGRPGPGTGGIGGIDRPTTLPGQTRPGIGGGGTNPIKPDHPQIGGGNVNRPGNQDRPWIGGNRPNIGGGNNNNIGNNIINNNISNNINNNNVNINNWNRPGWGVGGGNWNNGNWNNGHWHDHWNNNYVNRHYHGWYHGCWNGHWSNNWYGPWVIGVSAWGLGSLAGWGYGSAYYNPYYIAASTPVYNYSQPVVVQNYYTTDDSGADVPAAPQPTAAQLQPFDDGLAKFKAADYPGALQKFDQALGQFPNDPVIHEVRALTLFALGRYQEAGAALNALLATSPGMDWTTMSGLYGDPSLYTQQLRKLEDYCRANKTDAAALFALTYQYLVIGQQDTAINLLKHIVKLQPKDQVAQRMLAALAPDQAPAAPDPTPVPPANPANAADAPKTDLVGKWQATAGKTTIELTITEDSQYTWAATTADQKPVKLDGQLTTSPDAMILSNAAQGDMMGKVKSLGPDKFEFTIAGSPPGEPGLSFSRVK